jgi:hypothetical protein
VGGFRQPGLLTFGSSLSAVRTRGPWEPEWIKLERAAYWRTRARQDDREVRIGRSEAGYVWLRRVQAIGHVV